MNGTCTCGCCEGVEKATPQKISNRPGLPALAYRVGTHATFWETMLARLSDLKFAEAGQSGTRNPLLDLKTRAADDPAIAFLDAWATVAEVLTFYQERIANEGYLPTATERRSILELAKLVGYVLRPGVAASVYLAFEMEKDQNNVLIPAGVRAQSIPGPGELPQSFETSESLAARFVWNAIKPRLRRPQLITSTTPVIYFKGVSTNLKVNDPILIDFGTGISPIVRRVLSVEADAAANRTKVSLALPPRSAPTTSFPNFLDKFLQPRSFGTIPPPNSLRLGRNLAVGFRNKSDQISSLITQFRPDLRSSLSTALRSAAVTAPSQVRVYALRVAASLFGHNAPKEPQYEPARIPDPADPTRLIDNPNAGNLKPQSTWPEWSLALDETLNQIFLDAVYEQIVTGSESYVAIRKNDGTTQVFKNITSVSMSRNAYGLSAKTTRITLLNNWWAKENFGVIRGTAVYAQNELLELAEEPIARHIGFNPNDQDDKTDPNGSALARQIELDNIYDGLESGRWVIVSGERDDITGVTGVRAKELVMLAGATQDFDSARPGDTTHTTLQFANSLAFSYKRDTVTINANVVRATHGETRSEVLGSGDGSKKLQSFALKQSPLTYVSATTPNGIESTLQVRVNDVLWHESDSLVALAPADRRYITQTDNESKTAIIFGDGVQGARLPSGIENIKAVYRTGIGKPGNVADEQISLLSTRPLGVKGVINPQQATGGADPEDRDHARRNTPVHLKALDRAVSVADYADFARAFTGIGKARAIRLSDGRRELVHLTIAGADDIPIDTSSDLYRNLQQALHDFGDPNQPIQIDARELKLLVISAQVKLLPDYLWEAVAPQVRAALLDTFSFERRDLGQDALASEVISAMQAVPGVDYVDLDNFTALSQEIIIEHLSDLNAFIEDNNFSNNRIPLDVARVELIVTGPVIRPAQLAYLSPAVPDTLILTERT